MPEKETLERAHEDAEEGKSPSTQAGEFVREEMDHICEGKHGAASTKQAIAIGLSKARRAGVKLAPPKKGKTSPKVRAQAARDIRKGQSGATKKTSRNTFPCNQRRTQTQRTQRGLSQISVATGKHRPQPRPRSPPSLGRESSQHKASQRERLVRAKSDVDTHNWAGQSLGPILLKRASVAVAFKLCPGLVRGVPESSELSILTLTVGKRRSVQMAVDATAPRPARFETGTHP